MLFVRGSKRDREFARHSHHGLVTSPRVKDGPSVCFCNGSLRMWLSGNSWPVDNKLREAKAKLEIHPAFWRVHIQLRTPPFTQPSVC